MADTFNTDYTLQLFPKAPEQVPIRETIERVAGRMLGIANAEIDALQAKVGDYDNAMFSDRTITELLQTQGIAWTITTHPLLEYTLKHNTTRTVLVCITYMLHIMYIILACTLESS